MTKADTYNNVGIGLLSLILVAGIRSAAVAEGKFLSLLWLNDKSHALSSFQVYFFDNIIGAKSVDDAQA